MTQLYAISIREPLSSVEYMQLLSGASPARQDRTSRYRFEDDRLRGVLGDGAVRYLLQKEQIVPDEIVCAHNEHGKPYFSNVKDRFFNVSHSGDWVLCAWSSEEVGVDVELVRPVNMRVSNIVFHPLERNALEETHDEKTRCELFFTFWTLKESYIKYCGKGFSMDLQSFYFQIHNGRPLLTVDGRVSPLQFYLYQIDSQHKVAVCTSTASAPAMQQLSVEEILKTLNGKHIADN